jgi:hypothetical protein
MYAVEPIPIYEQNIHILWPNISLFLRMHVHVETFYKEMYFNVGFFKEMYLKRKFGNCRCLVDKQNVSDDKFVNNRL